MFVLFLNYSNKKQKKKTLSIVNQSSPLHNGTITQNLDLEYSMQYSLTWFEKCSDGTWQAANECKVAPPSPSSAPKSSAIAGIVVGAVGGVGLLSLALVGFVRWRQRKVFCVLFCFCFFLLWIWLDFFGFFYFF